MGDFSFKHDKICPTKDRWHDTAKMNKFNRQKKKYDVVNHAVYEIILQENNKVSDESESHENIEYDLDGNYLHQIENISLDDKK